MDFRACGAHERRGTAEVWCLAATVIFPPAQGNRCASASAQVLCWKAQGQRVSRLREAGSRAGVHVAAFLHCGDEVVEGADIVDHLLHDSRVGAEHSPWPVPSRTLAIGMPRACRSVTFDGSLPSVI